MGDEITLESIAAGQESIQKSFTELAGHVLTIANRVYAKDGMPYDDEENGSGQRMPPIPPKDEVKPVGKRSKQDEGDEDKDKVKDAVEKGYDATATERKNEEDAPFGEAAKVDDAGANEPTDPAEAVKKPPFTGNREDETLGGVAKAVRDLTAKMDAFTKAGEGSQTLVKAAAPPVVTRSTGRDPQEDQPILTRDMQKEATTRSFKEINRLRERVGDLPKHGFLG